MRKFCDPFFFADVSSSGITTSFQQVHLERSEAPPGALQHPRRGGVSTFSRCEAPFLLRHEIECRITPSLPAQKPQTPPQLQASSQAAPPHPSHPYLGVYG